MTSFLRIFDTIDDMSLIISLILSVASIIVAILYGYMPKKRKAMIDDLKDRIKRRDIELIALYKDIQNFINVESSLCRTLGISKQKARKGFTISQKSEPKRIEKRIIELEGQLKKL